MSKRPRISGWILPDGTYEECLPWEHIRHAKSMAWVVEQLHHNRTLSQLWDDPDEEKLRACLAALGLVKVCYHLVDADSLSPEQLRTLQKVYQVMPPDEDVEFIGRIRIRLQIRLLMKIRDPDRLNALC